MRFENLFKVTCRVGNLLFFSLGIYFKDIRIDSRVRIKVFDLRITGFYMINDGTVQQTTFSRSLNLVHLSDLG